MRWPTRLRRSEKPRRAPVEAILYSKLDCHLCDLAAELLATLSRSGELRWTRVDIQSDPSLSDRFQTEIPVIAIGDVELRWPTTLERIRRAVEQVADAR